MANEKFPAEQFNGYGFEDNFSFTNKSMDEGNTRTQSSFYGVEEWGESSDNGLYQNNQWEEELLMSKYDQQDQQQNSFGDYMHLDDLRFGILSPPLQKCYQEITQLDEIQSGIREVKSKKENPYAFPLASLELLKSHTNGFNQLNSMRMLEPNKFDSSIKVVGQELSTEDIMRIAGARFLQSSCHDVASMFNNPFDLYFSGLSDEDAKHVELAESLLASAERIGNQQYDSASRLLKQCDSISSNTGNPVQRVVYYFAEALHDRIDIETGKTKSKELGKKQAFEIDEAMMTPNPTILASHLETPFCQVAHFAGIQAIVDNVADAKKIHILDLSLRYGMQWTVLMQALVSRCDCPLEHLKITAIGTTSRELIENTGIKNMIATEGEERVIRNVKLDAWRAFFARFGMVETDLSSSALLQANLIVKKFACGNCFTLDRNGKSLVLGWKAMEILILRMAC
eukprot:XP_025013905.1 DELLA protein GAI1 [Ricinus communis]